MTDRVSQSQVPSAGSSHAKDQIAAVAKLIRDAQAQDEGRDELGAYRRYLECVQHLVHTLGSDVASDQGQGTLLPQQTQQLFKMAKHCLERAEEIYTTTQREGRTLLPQQQAPPTQQQVPKQPNPAQQQAKVAAQRPHPSQRQGPTARVMGFAPIAPMRAESWPPGPLTGNPSSTASGTASSTASVGANWGVGAGKQQSQPISHTHRFTYMDQAKLRNRHMMEQYKAYLRQTSTQMLPPSYHDVGLSMLRRLEENVSVARIKDQAIARKLKERETRIQQADVRKQQQKKSVKLSSMSVEDLCEQVATFEHGKLNLHSLKSRLSTSSNTTHICNFINEILSITDHPLARLLGESQYDVYQLMKPLGSAVETVGGLSHMEIKLDPSGQGPQASEPSPAVPIVVQPKEKVPFDVHEKPLEDDSHLDLLCSEDDDDLFALSAPPTTIPRVPSVGNLYGSPEQQNSINPLDTKLTKLREALASELTSREREIAESQTESESGNEELETIPPKNGNGNRTSDEAHIYVNTSKPEEPEEPTYVNTSTPADERKDPLYDNDEEIAAYFKARRARSTSDSVFLPDSGRFSEETHKSENPTPPLFPADEPDGGMFSRPAEGEKEVEELVVFKNLPPLVCTLHPGNEHALRQLSITAEPLVKDVIRLIRSSLIKLEEVFASCYPSLDSEDHREVCRTLLEATLFPAILPTLTMVCRCSTYSEEIAMAKNMCHYANATPKDLSVRKKFWLIEQDHAPYGPAINELRRIPSLQWPAPKLDCLVRLSKLIIQCIDEYYEAQGMPKGSMDTSVGVDDILPILSYIIIRSGLPQLVSECSIMEEFIHEGYMKGEEGFCLTSFQTALRFVSHMQSSSDS